MVEAAGFDVIQPPDIKREREIRIGGLLHDFHRHEFNHVNRRSHGHLNGISVHVDFAIADSLQAFDGCLTISSYIPIRKSTLYVPLSDGSVNAHAISLSLFAPISWLTTGRLSYM